MNRYAGQILYEGMGDLVLTEDEVNPVMSAILHNGLDVTALHNRFFWELPVPNGGHT